MRRIVTLLMSLSILGVGLLAVVPQAYAVDVLPPSVCNNPNATQRPAVCKDNQANAPDNQNPIFGPHGILTIVINILSLAVGIVSVFVIIIGGVKFITSSGDPSSVTNARNNILYAIIALVIAALSQAIVHFVLIKLAQE